MPASQKQVDLDRKKKMRRGFFAIAAIGALAFSMLWNPPTGSVHSYTKASDYNAKKESGCVNSGEGCHGDESAYTDFNDYHPEVECGTCHEYTGVGCIPCHSPAEHECALCHDGTMEIAGDRVRLSDPYPRGHYRESTHTAMGTDFDIPVRGVADGEAQATCKQCHKRDLRKAHTKVAPAQDSRYGEDIGCGECHNDRKSFGQREVLADWKDRSCEACHSEKSATPMHAVADIEAPAQSKFGCGVSGTGCHDYNDLHSLHRNVPQDCSSSAADGEPGCHDLTKEAHVPTAVTCGGTGEGVCHASEDPSGYEHKDAEVHSPTEPSAAAVAFIGARCGDCHRMDPDGASLVEEHALPTSVRETGKDECRTCHDHPGSAETIVAEWPERNGAESCTSCHGVEGIGAQHATANEAAHIASNSSGCAGSGPGCHSSTNLTDIGVPTPEGGLHSTCLRCHDWRGTNGNLAYDPTADSCGNGRACHGSGFSASTGVHTIGGATVGGTDPLHQAGAAQARAVYYEQVSGNSPPCGDCHGMTLATEHGRPNSAIASGTDTTICERCHNHRTATAQNVKDNWPERGSDAACSACHGQPGVNGAHHAAGTSHYATELGADGKPKPGACAESGCHQTRDVRRLMKGPGCTNEQCHSNTGDIRGTRIRSCGGNDAAKSCHVGYSSTQHFQQHTADLTGTVAGVAYTEGANVGCFGCHYKDLAVEHSAALRDGSMEGGGDSNCDICHAIADDAGAGKYAGLPAVRDAIARGDRRCVACHNSGSKADGPIGVASPHSDTSSATVRPDGKVWADPLAGWKVAFESPTGGGHNTITSATVVGAAQVSRFPETSFTVDASAYGWGIYNNAGVISGRPTMWIRPSILPTASVNTTEATRLAARNIMVKCTDCHWMPEDAVGPQGAAVKVYITPGYSQTEYANPSEHTFQFDPLDIYASTSPTASSSFHPPNPAGYKPVVCFKCHTVFHGSVPETDGVIGGASLHRSHRWHRGGTSPNYTWEAEVCVDCHLRIPHAWRSPRLLVRTIANTPTPDARPLDAPPYVRPGHDGLRGIKLKDYSDPTLLVRQECATGGCYGGTNGHPRSDQLTQTTSFWP